MAATMTRARDGQVLKRKWKSGRGFALRFIAYGQRYYLTLGSEHDGWTARKAELELQNVMADVRRGTWIPPDRNRRTTIPAQESAPDLVTFHQFATGWLAGREGEVSDGTYEYLQWALVGHLLPYFASWRVAEIDIQAVDDYRRYKIQQAQQRRVALEDGKPVINRQGQPLRPLGARSINMTINVLRMILGVAVEYGQLAANPAAGRRRRLKQPAARPVHLDSLHQIQALLDGADELDRDPRWRACDRRVIVTTLVLAGPRISELLLLLWRDVDLANDRIEIGRSKTQAGLREIHLLPVLRDELAAHKARSTRTGPDDPVFPTRTGKPRSAANLRNRTLAATITCANALLEQRGHPPLPVGVTPHKLRHTFASILVACGEDPASVMAQLGHTDPRFTLRVYTHLMRRNPGERERLKAFVYGEPLVRPQSSGTESPGPTGATVLSAAGPVAVAA